MNHTRLLRGAGLVAILAIVVTVMAWPDLQHTARADSTEFQSPSELHEPTLWTNPTRAFESDEDYATEGTAGDKQGYATFDLDVPPGAFVLGIAVQVEAFSSDSSGCAIDVDLSWNDGGDYTDPKSAPVTDVESVQTVGGSSDDWGRDWLANEFDNDEFVARVTLAGGDCDGSATTSLNHIQVNVYFKALTDTGFQPAKASVDPNDWVDPDNAFANDGDYATSSEDNEDQGYMDFNLAVPDPAIIVGIEVQVEARSEDDEGCQLLIRISGEDGPFTTFRSVDLTDEDTTYTVGGADDLWENTWLPSDFSDDNFVLEVRNDDDEAECNTNSDAFLDVVAVRVHYKPLQESGKAFPSATHEPNGWTDADLAFDDDNADAVGENGGDEQGYSEFDLDIPVASIIMGISVQVDATSEDDADCSLLVELSGTGGATFTDPRTIDLTNIQTTSEVGGDLDLWDTSWSVASFSNDNFVVRLTNDDTDGDCENDSDVLVDFIQVNVIYKEIDDEGFSPPSATHEPNEWTDPENAFDSGDPDATEDTDGDEQGYSEFGFSVDESAVVTGIEVRVLASSDDDEDCELHVRLSWNDGGDYTDPRIVELTNLQETHAVGGSEDTWERSWVPSDFDDDDFVVKITNVDATSCDPPNTFLDLIEVNVYFKTATPPATNTPTITDTPEDTNTPEDTGTPTITATPTITPTGTATATPTITNTPTITDTPTATDTPTVTDTPTNTPTPTKPLGDVNDDGAVDSVDALLILQYDARLIKSLLNPSSADVNEDDAINAVDANLILQFVAGFISQLPP